MQKRLHDISVSLQRRSTAEFPRTLGDVYGTIKMGLALRAFWPLSSLNESWNAIDVSGQGRTLTNNGSVTFGDVNEVPYAILNGSSQWLSRPDEAGLDIVGGLTFGAWMYCNTNGTLYMPMGKMGAAGNYSYCIQRIATNYYRATISGDGTATKTSDMTVLSSQTTWEFVAARFIPSTELAIFVNGGYNKVTTTVPASIFSGNGNFAIGRWDGGATQYFPGRIALPFICAANLTDANILRIYTITRNFFGV